MLQKLKRNFSIKNYDYQHKIITLFGKSFKVKYKRKVTYEDLCNIEKIFQQDFTTAFLHQRVFTKYKNKYQGKTIVLCGAGRSLEKYVNPVEGAIHVSLNRAFLHKAVNFDYLFAQDWRGIDYIKDEFKNYKGNNCVKFIGTQNGIEGLEIPESYIQTFAHERYITDIYKKSLTKKSEFALDLSTQPIGNFNTVALAAMQFILWTNPAKIYIVGCDSAPVGHFDRMDSRESDKKALLDGAYDYIIEQWGELKKFANLYYPDTQIISVNPIGLKGIFIDKYWD